MGGKKRTVKLSHSAKYPHFVQIPFVSMEGGGGGGKELPQDKGKKHAAVIGATINCPPAPPQLNL